jgi:endonuclease/exonuclease/phosphatase family metal-dependent hydrolase
MRLPSLACAALVLAAACGGDDAPVIDAPVIDAPPPIDAPGADAMGAQLPEQLPEPLPAGPVTAEVLTFNLGLIDVVRGAPERLPHILQAIRDSGADLVCLQEVYLQYTSPDEVARALAADYPYAAWTWETSALRSNGLLIASKVPLYRQRFLRFTRNDNVVDRAVLAATAVADDWHAHVLCTHLHAGLFAEPTEIRQSQVAEIGTFVTSHGYAAGPALLLGDFNAGPKPVPDPGEECPGQAACPATCFPVDTETIDQVVAAGWTDRADALGFQACTWCKPEATALEVISLFPCEGSQRIDHCFSRGLGTATITAMTRAMDEPQEIALPSGEPARTLSDHYGVRCSIGVP